MPSGGVIGYFGYEYQFYATSLLMLNAHDGMDSSFKLSVETLFGDDAELERRKEKRLDTEQIQDDVIIQVQVKTRQQTHHWRPSDIRDLLLKRDESVKGGKTVLDKLYSLPKSVFLFVTDGSVVENLSGLLADKIGLYKHKYSENKLKEIRQTIIQSDRTGKYSRILTRKLTKNVLSRVFIIANLSFEDVERQIWERLLWNYAIPNHRIYQKTEELAVLIRDCARRKNGKSFIVNSDVTEIIGTSGVKLPNQEVELLYQKTDEYDLAFTILNQKHIVLLHGEPGFGKTTLAYKLTNELVSQHYRFELIGGENSHLDIVRACLGRDNVVFLLDDGFGYDGYKGEWGESLGNSFEQIVLQLQEAKGRVKVLITSRHDVLMQAYANTKLSSATLNDYLVSILPLGHAFDLTVFKAHLGYLRVKPEVAEAITAVTLSFENLHHVRSFAHAIIRLGENPSQENLLSILEETKPSLYVKWIEKQLPTIQLFLISLWIILEVNQFALEFDVKNVFDTLSSYISLPSIIGFSAPYGAALRDLLERDRVVLRRGNSVEFIHPTLKKAISQFFENIPNNKDFVTYALNSLTKLDHPLAQSIAVYLTINYLLDTNRMEMLSLAASSKYIQVRDTIIRFGEPLLKSENQDIKQLAEKVYSTSFHPLECTIDENGYLIVPKYALEGGPHAYLGSDLAEMLLWETVGFMPDKEPELAVKFQTHLDEQSFMLLNPLERYKFLDWVFGLYKNQQADLSVLLSIVEFLSVDPISFVRQRVAEHIEIILDTPNTKTVIVFLCYDSSPYVKIAVLEDVILRAWSKQNGETQKLWLELVVSMLDDAVVRYRCTRGLVDQSGSLFFYHQEHNEEQKREWFAALALKLLEHTFEADDADRFLSAFDKHYMFFPVPFRVDLLNSLNSYVERNPFHARDIVPTVERIIFDKNSFKDEFDVLLNLINHVPPIAKAELGFQMAYHYGELPDKRFEEFVQRPFYVEDPREYTFERTAIILGYLANHSAAQDFDKLPIPIRETGNDFEDAISNYIDKQSDEFKLILLFQVFGHKYSYQVSAMRYSLYLNPIIKKLIDGFIVEKQHDLSTKVLAHVLLTDGYYRTDAYSGNQTEWSRYVDVLLSSGDVGLIKIICDILFQANIDSNVHNTSDWLVLLFRILTHPSEDVRLHAAALFDKYFFDIWSDVSYFLREEHEKGRKAVSSLWGDNDFFQYLLSVCPSFREYVETKLLTQKLVNNWPSFTKKEKDFFIGYIIDKADANKYYINALIEEFVEELGNKLKIEHKKKLLAAITPPGEQYSDVDVLGRIKYLHSSDDLQDLLPKFDWSKYLS